MGEPKARCYSWVSLDGNCNVAAVALQFVSFQSALVLKRAGLSKLVYQQKHVNSETCLCAYITWFYNTKTRLLILDAITTLAHMQHHHGDQ